MVWVIEESVWADTHVTKWDKFVPLDAYVVKPLAVVQEVLDVMWAITAGAVVCLGGEVLPEVGSVIGEESVSDCKSEHGGCGVSGGGRYASLRLIGFGDKSFPNRVVGAVGWVGNGPPIGEGVRVFSGGALFVTFNLPVASPLVDDFGTSQSLLVGSRLDPVECGKRGDSASPQCQPPS